MKGWGDYKKLPDESPDYRLIRRMLLGAVSAVQTPRMGAFETDERRMAVMLQCYSIRSLLTWMKQLGDE